MSYCIAQTSLGHTYGNVTCFIVDYVKSLFPPNYFNTVHISSTIAYRQFDIFKNSKKEFFKKAPPMLIVRPRVELNDTDTFLNGTYLTTRILDSYMDTSFTNLQPFIHDEDTGVHIKFLLNRLKLIFDVMIITETQMDQLNQAHYLKNRVRQDRPFFLKTSLESYIPREMMELLAQDVGIPLYDENNSIKPFLDYVNGISSYPISYKLKNSSGNDEFFRFYPVNIDTTIGNLSIDEGTSKGQIYENFTITFSISTEFNSSGLYYYFNQKPDNINNFIRSNEDDSHIIPLFTVNNLHVDKLEDGWQVYAAPIYKVGDDVPDILDLKQLLNTSMINCIEFHKANGMQLGMFMKIVVLKDNREMSPYKKEFDVDLDNYQLITYNCNPDSTYRIIIHVNTLYVNQTVNDLLKLDEEK